MNQTNQIVPASAFWVNPDWELAESRQVPFWCVDPLPSRPEPVRVTPRRWHTNRGGSRITDTMVMTDAMRVINDGWDEEPPVVTFDHVRGIEHVFLDCLDLAGREAFGRRYVGIRSWGKAPTVFVWEGQYYRQDEIHLQTDISVIYKGLTDFLSDAGVFNEVRRTYAAVIEREVLGIYSKDVRVSMPHRGHYKHKGDRKRSAGFIPTLIVKGRRVDLLSGL